MMQALKRRYDAKRLRRAYKAVFRNDESGQLVLHDILRYCHLFRTSFVAGDTHATAVKEGQRDVGLYLLRIMGYKESDAETLLEDSRNYLVSSDIESDQQ